MAAIILIVMLWTKFAMCESIQLIETRYDHSAESPRIALPRYRVRLSSKYLMVRSGIRTGCTMPAFDEPWNKARPVKCGIK